MIRYALALVMLAFSTVGAAAMPSETAAGVSSEMAPFRGDTQATPKGQSPESAPVAQVPAQTGKSATMPLPVSETQGLAQGQPAAPAPRVVPDVPQAQDRPPPAEEPRYSFYRVNDTFVRLDSRTGHVAQCGWSDTGWSCKALPDERSALESEIARLQAQNAALKKALLSHGLALPGAGEPEVAAQSDSTSQPKQPEAAPAPQAPSRMNFDGAIAFMKGVWQRLVEMVADLQRDIQRRG